LVGRTITCLVRFLERKGRKVGGNLLPSFPFGKGRGRQGHVGVFLRREKLIVLGRGGENKRIPLTSFIRGEKKKKKKQALGRSGKKNKKRGKFFQKKKKKKIPPTKKENKRGDATLRMRLSREKGRGGKERDWSELQEKTLKKKKYGGEYAGNGVERKSECLTFSLSQGGKKEGISLNNTGDTSLSR